MPSDDAILAALTGAHGKISFAAEKLGCTVDHIRRRAAASEKIRQALAHFGERMADAAAAALWKSVLDRESWAVKFALERHDEQRALEGSGAGDFVSQEGRATVQEVLGILLQNDEYVEFCRTRHAPVEREEVEIPAGAD